MYTDEHSFYWFRDRRENVGGYIGRAEERLDTTRHPYCNNVHGDIRVHETACLISATLTCGTQSQDCIQYGLPAINIAAKECQVVGHEHCVPRAISSSHGLDFVVIREGGDRAHQAANIVNEHCNELWFRVRISFPIAPG